MSIFNRYRNQKFHSGMNEYLSRPDETGLQFNILKLNQQEEFDFYSDDLETAILLIQGSGEILYQNEKISFERPNWLEHNPFVAHLPLQTHIHLRAESGSRFAVVQTVNPEEFPGRIYLPTDVSIEHRGQHLLGGTCYRLVRLVFDRSIAPANSKLVLGEVLNYPGRWSSFPPHHHCQPEIYYYEFDPTEGYGHGELGDQVHKIFHQDLLKITDNRDHSQVAAPGYHLYYLWAIRHLDQQPYVGFEFTAPYDRLLKTSR